VALFPCTIALACRCKGKVPDEIFSSKVLGGNTVLTPTLRLPSRPRYKGTSDICQHSAPFHTVQFTPYGQFTGGLVEPTTNTTYVTHRTRRSSVNCLERFPATD
jgi:hypothetical protein